LTLDKALEKASEEGLDLVEVSIKDGVSICKLMDYNKFLYEQNKKEKQAKVKSGSMKEIRFRYNIADHDLKIRANKARNMLEDGHKVKVNLMYSGRAISRIREGKEIIDKFLQFLDLEVQILKEPKIEGNNYSMTLGYK